jgi:hypothetical protein
VTRDREPEARAFSLGRKKRIEHARTNLGRYTASSVVDVDDHAHPFGHHPHVDAAAPRHGLARIAKEIQERLP